MRNRCWMIAVGLAFLCARSADAQSVIPSFAASNSKSAVTSAASGLSSFLGSAMGSRPSSSPLSFRPSMPGGLSLRSFLPSSSSSFQNAMTMRAGSSGATTFQVLPPNLPPTKKK